MAATLRRRLEKLPLYVKLLMVLSAAILAVWAIFGVVFGYYYFKYQSVVDARLSGPIFAHTAQIYAAPRQVRPDQKYTVQQIANDLRNAGYTPVGDSHTSPLGTYEVIGDSIHIQPGPQSYHAPDGATVYDVKGVVKSITGDDKQQLESYELEPQLITELSDKNRAKRRLVTYDEMPPQLIQAVLAIEDRRFFEHGGVNYYRLLEAAIDDIRTGHKEQGASTITMQLARGFFLSPAKRYKRKIIEIAITFHLEHRFDKRQIFTMYANEINLGQRGSFSINGFGEAAQAFFGKDVRQLTLPECALLAGMIQSPSRLNPYRHPGPAVRRRNVVLDSMVETHAITEQQATIAKATPLQLAPFSVDAGEAPYFVDLVRDRLTQRYGDRDINGEGLHIYTSLDPDLQRIATDVVEAGMRNVDALVRRRYTHRSRGGVVTVDEHITYPQVALIALDPHTGQVLSLVGGRNYGMSQLNHAVASRPTGSVFKPFVYAAAFNSSLTGVALSGQQGVFTALTILNDSDQTFTYDNGNMQYSPHNYKNEDLGMITARVALMKSQNVATVALAGMVGYDNVAALAKQAGITSVEPTPAMAIGTYSATPLDVAGAYTTFANGGIHMQPWMIASVRNPNGDVIDDFTTESKPILDPRVAYLTLSLMRDVINHGTAERVRGLGFTAPAAGKTGTSHDAWFAGFTSNLLCVIWVGNDDYTDIKLEGAQVAAPIWAEFMKEATKLPQYSDTQYFDPPAGITEVSIDKNTNLLADASCPDDYTAAFLDGTQPTTTCDHPNGDQRNIFQKIFGLGGNTPPAPALNNLGNPEPTVKSGTASATNRGTSPENTTEEQKKKKKGFFGKVFGIFKGDDNKNKQPQPDQNQPQNQ
ncbi:MAG TPA: transglycosylase domain-containing protein [Acidobacteriaceae bacterium]|jgi:penicillin-binding protein 1B|nr:transglycosylase domain-containing protein [Acidobacteriaceae bacterium]